MRYLVAMLLVLALVGCKEKPDNEEHFRDRPQGGSSTVLGKSRDRALDAELLHEMNQLSLGFTADMARETPATKDDWLRLLNGYKALPRLIREDKMVAGCKVLLGNSQQVILYEKRIETDPDAIVMTADGKGHRMTKAQFDLLKKPAK